MAAGRCVHQPLTVIVAGLSDEQQRHFRDHLEWWDSKAKLLLAGAPPEGTDAPYVDAAMRVFFNGWYDVEEDDFAGDTYYANPEMPDGSYQRFTAHDKRKCGFLYLRTLRTGARALSLERSSLLDVILRLKETRRVQTRVNSQRSSAHLRVETAAAVNG